MIRRAVLLFALVLSLTGCATRRCLSEDEYRQTLRRCSAAIQDCYNTGAQIAFEREKKVEREQGALIEEIESAKKSLATCRWDSAVEWARERDRLRLEISRLTEALARSQERLRDCELKSGGTPQNDRGEAYPYTPFGRLNGGDKQETIVAQTKGD